MKIEFYFDKTGTLQKKIWVKFDGVPGWDDFDKLSPEQVESIFGRALKNKRAHSALIQLSKFITGKNEILKQFIHCNWSVLDKIWDIGEPDIDLNFESVQCPHKHSGNCPFDGKGLVCIK